MGDIRVMEFGEFSIKDKLGRTIILRNARPEDSKALIKYLRITSAETPYLIREPEEITITEEKEKQFIQDKIDAERELMLVAFFDGKHIAVLNAVLCITFAKCYRRPVSLRANWAAWFNLCYGSVFRSHVFGHTKNTLSYNFSFFLGLHIAQRQPGRSSNYTYSIDRCVCFRGIYFPHNNN